MNKIFLFLLLIILYSCSKHQNSPIDFVTISIPSEATSSFELSDIAGEVSYVKLETNDSCLIGDIDKMFYTRDFIIIGCDNNKIFFFNKNGTFSHKFFRQGNGPEEYIRISDFDIDKDNHIISVLDTRKKQFVRYDWYGNFVDKADLGYWAIGLQQLNDSINILYSGNQTSQENEYKFSLYNFHKKEICNHFYSIPKEKSSYLHIHSVNNFSKCMDEVLFCELYNDTIYSISPLGCTPRFYLDFGKQKVPSSFYQMEFANIMEFQDKFFKHDFSYGINSLANFSTGFIVSCFMQKKKHFLYCDKERQNCTAFTKLTDKKYLGNIPVDIVDGEVQFYSDGNYLLMLANNEVYMQDRTEGLPLAGQLGTVKMDDNPIIRVCKVKTD